MKRQRLRLKAPDNWINDPNGFIYFNGNYHLFYQYFPYGPKWGTMHWGHGVSKDLVNWEHKGIALFPTKRGDQNGCFSGSAVEKDGKLYLFYTGVRYEVVDPENIHVSINDQFESLQMMITSDDGFHFDNWNGKKVVVPPVMDRTVGHPTHTRDPKVWKGKDGWYMVLGSTIDEKQGEVLFFKSEDLQTWTYVNKATKGEGMGWMWECPDYFETKGGKVLFLSIMGIPQNGEEQQNHSVCMPVEFQESSCEMKIPDTYQFIDHGLDLYAPQTTVDEAGRRIMAAWIRMPKVTEEGWIGMFCSPRVVEMENGHIYFRLHPNVKKACSREISDLSQADPSGYRLSFQLQEGEKIDIGGFLICRKDGQICTDRSAVFPSVKGGHFISRTPRVEDGCQMDVVVDKNLIEVFVNDGEYVISNAVYGLGNQITGEIAAKIHIYTLEEEDVSGRK